MTVARLKDSRNNSDGKSDIIRKIQARGSFRENKRGKLIQEKKMNGKITIRMLLNSKGVLLTINFKRTYNTHNYVINTHT